MSTCTVDGSEFVLRGSSRDCDDEELTFEGEPALRAHVEDLAADVLDC